MEEKTEAKGVPVAADAVDLPAWVEKLSHVDRPCDITIYVAPGCPHCPQAVHAANQVAAMTPLVTVCVVDVQKSPDLAKNKGVKSVPLTVLDDDFSFSRLRQKPVETCPVGIIPLAKIVLAIVLPLKGV